MTYDLHLGDCLDIMPKLAEGGVDMVFADLPYGVTANAWDAVIPFEPLWEGLLRCGSPSCAFAFTATQPFATALISSQPKLFRYDLIWEKNQPSGFVNANKMPLKTHESICVFYKSTPAYNPQKLQGKAYSKRDTGKAPSENYHGAQPPKGTRQYDGARHPTTVLCVPLDHRKSMAHPTQKPVALLEWLIKTYSNPGDTILDPTMGSGTTGVACMRTRRKFIGIEKDPHYFAIARERISTQAKAMALAC